MSNKFLDKIKSGFVWLGREIVDASTWVPKILKEVKDIQSDAPVVIPEIVYVLQDAEALGKAAVEDSGAAIAASLGLVAAIENAAAVKGLNIASDEAVGVALEQFISAVATKTNYKDILSVVQKLAIDVDTLGASVMVKLRQLEADSK